MLKPRSHYAESLTAAFIERLHPRDLKGRFMDVSISGTDLGLLITDNKNGGRTWVPKGKEGELKGYLEGTLPADRVRITDGRTQILDNDGMTDIWVDSDQTGLLKALNRDGHFDAPASDSGTSGNSQKGDSAARSTEESVASGRQVVNPSNLKPTPATPDTQEYRDQIAPDTNSGTTSVPEPKITSSRRQYGTSTVDTDPIRLTDDRGNTIEASEFNLDDGDDPKYAYAFGPKIKKDGTPGNSWSRFVGEKYIPKNVMDEIKRMQDSDQKGFTPESDLPSGGSGDSSPASGGGDFLDADAVAERYVEAAKAKEPKLTNAMQNLADEYGGSLEGLDFRIKGAKSLARKLASEVSDMSAPPTPTAERAAEKMFDVNRYTVSFPEEKYAESIQSALDDLRKQGYELKVKNYWNVPSNPYKGVNVQAIDPSGDKFELQFHTKESLAAKEGKLHTLYEEQRELDPVKDADRIAELDRQMFLVSAGVKDPAGISDVH